MHRGRIKTFPADSIRVQKMRLKTTTNRERPKSTPRSRLEKAKCLKHSEANFEIFRLEYGAKTHPK